MLASNTTATTTAAPPVPAVAWVLSSLEGLKATQEARGVPDWKPPPVAVLPLGTGGRVMGRADWRNADVLLR